MKKYVISADIGKFETEIIGRDLAGSKDGIRTIALRTKM